MSISALLVLAFICNTRCHSLYQATVYEIRTNSSPGIATNNGTMSAFESSSSVIPYYLQGHLAAGIEHTTVFEIVQNIRVISWPYDLYYPAARLNNQCKSTPNFLELEGQVHEMIKYPNIWPSGLSYKQYKSNSLPKIGKNNGLMTDFKSSPNKNPYYLQGLLAAGIAPTKPRETNPNADRFSIPGSSYPEARSNIVCESTPYIFGLEGQVPEVIKYPNILPSLLSSKQNKLNSLPDIVTNNELMPAFEPSPSKNPYYLQEPTAAGIAPTKPRETNPNADRFSIPGSSYPEAKSNVLCESTPNIFGLEGLVPEVIKYPNILPSGLSSKQHKSNSLPGIVTNDELMPAFQSSPSKNLYYLQGPSAAAIAPTKPRETNPNADRFSIPGSSYPEARSNVVCESLPNILGLERLVPEVIEHHNIFPLGSSYKQYKSNSLPGIVTNDELMPAFESLPSKNLYYLQGASAAGIAPTKPRETNPNADRFSISGSSYPEAVTNVVCESSPNIFGLEGLVPEVIKYPNILPSGLSSKQHKSNSWPGIVTNDELMPAFESSLSNNPYYLQRPSAAGIAPKTPSETNPKVDRFSIPYGSSYPEAGTNVVCESTPTILGLEGLVPEVIKHPNILPSGLSFKQNKSNLLPGIITRKALMPAFESSPSKNPYYLQGPSAAGIAPTTTSETNPNVDRFSIPCSFYREAGTNVVCESTPNILGLEGLVPEVIKHPNIFPLGLSSNQNNPNLLPGIITRKALMPDITLSPNKNPYHLQGPSADNITPTTVLETNPNVNEFSTPYGILYPEAGSKVVCESPPNIIGIEGLEPVVIENHNIFPSGLSSKQYKSNSLPGIVTNDELMPASESAPSKNPYYQQGPLAAGIAPTIPRETNPNVDRFSIRGLSFPEAGTYVVRESTPNILGLEGLVPEVIKHPNILLSALPLKQNKSNSLPGIVTNDELMPASESAPSKNPYYQQGPLAAGIAPSNPRETNPNVDRFSFPGSSYPEAGTNVVCESTPNILGLEGLVPEVIKHPNNLLSALPLKQNKSNSLPGIVTNDELMPASESAPSKNPYYQQGPLAAGIAPTNPRETNPNVDRFSFPGSSYPEAGTNVVCESTPNILGLEGLVPEVIKHPNIIPLGLSFKQKKSYSLPGIITRKALMPASESSPSKNPYYQQGPLAAGIAPTNSRETNPNVDRFSFPGSSYPEAGTNFACESTPNILGLEGLVPELIKHHYIFPSGLSFKQKKSYSLPGIITRKALMPDLESSPNKNPYYLQGHSEANITPITVLETNPNVDRFSMPYGLPYPEARSKFVCESPPNILSLEGLVPEVIEHHKILPSGLSSKQHNPKLLPGIITRKALMPASESSPSKNPYYQQGPLAAGIAPTTTSKTNPNVDRFSIPCSSYPEAGTNVVCESPPNILGLEGLVPQVIEDHNIFPSGLSSKQNKSNSLPGIVTNDELMPAFESSPSKNPYYQQGPLAAGIASTTTSEINPNVDRFSIPGSSYPEAGTNVVCESTPNILGLQGLVPEVIENHNIFPAGLSSKQYKSNSLPGIDTNDELMPAFKSSPSKNPYYLQGLSPAGLAPTTPSETNPNVERFSIRGSSYPEAGTNVVCESSPNIFGLKGLVPEVIKYPNILPSGLSSKQHKSNFWPGIVTNDELMPAFVSSPRKNPYYLQGSSAAGIAPKTSSKTNPNADGFSIPYGSSYPEAGSDVVCESPPNILGLDGLVPEVIENHNIIPSGLSPKQYKSNSLSSIGTNDELMPTFESSPSKNSYYLQGPTAAGTAPTKPRETNPNVDRFSFPGSSYPEAGTNIVCEFAPSILGLKGLVPELIKHPNIFPSGLSFKQYKSNSLPGTVTNNELMPAFESYPSNNPYYQQGPSAAGIAPTNPRQSNQNADGFSMPYSSSYSKAGSNVVFKSTPNILGLERLVPEVIEHHNIFPSGLSYKEYKSNSLPGIVTNDELMPVFESLPSKNPYYLQGASAAGIAPTKPCETNPNADRLSISGSSFPEAGTNIVCESSPNSFGLEVLVPEVIKHPNIFPSGLSSKQFKSNSLPGIVTNDELMPAFESSPTKNQYYLKGPSAACVAPITVCESNPNIGEYCWPFCLCYPETAYTFVCESTPNILGLVGVVPEDINHSKILHSGLSPKQCKSNLLPNIGKYNGLMTDLESSPKEIPYYLQRLAAADIVPTTVRKINPNVD